MRYFSVPVSLLVLLFALGSGLVLTGCPDKKPKFPNCGKDSDCKEGQHCFNKHCSQCSEDAHCESHESCNGGSCIVKPGMCNDKSDCTAGQICENNTCTACTEDEQCGPGARCSGGACLSRGACNADEDCQDDEDCIDGTCQGAGGEDPDLACTLDSVFFGFDEYSVADAAKETLQKTSTCLQEAPDRKVLVEGHTDDQGTDEYNIALSEKRGRSVADFLARLGMDPARLQVVPKGEAEASGTDDEARAQERRVDFEWQ